MTFAVFNMCSNNDESRRLKHRRLSFFAYPFGQTILGSHASLTSGPV
jgi:hypothetical protein